MKKLFKAILQKLNEFLSQFAHGFVIAHPQRRIVQAPTHYHAVIILYQAVDNMVTRSRKNIVRFLIFGTSRASLGMSFFHFFTFFSSTKRILTRPFCGDPIFYIKSSCLSKFSTNPILFFPRNYSTKLFKISKS